MRAFPLFCVSFLLISLGNLCAEQLPEMRPALLGTGPRSLVNLIDTDFLMKRGQTDAMVMFTCSVTDLGYSYDTVTFRGTPNSNPLAEEAVNKSARAIFIPAVYQHKNRHSVILGTIIFRVIQGKPHLRIYLNQEKEHLLHGNDFISPQPIFFQGQKFKGFEYPQRGIGFSATVVEKRK